MNIETRISSIVKEELRIGLIHTYDSFSKNFGADPEDILHIIDAVEREFVVTFTDKEHFEVDTIADLIKIVKTKDYDQHEKEGSRL